MAAQQVHNQQLHVVFFPFMAHSHTIPLFDAARLLAARGVKAVFVTTAANAPVISESDNVELEIIRFPSEEVGLPKGIESAGQITGIAAHNRFIEALRLMTEGPLAEVIRKRRPSCLVSDLILPWGVDVAARAGIPWVAFHVCGCFSIAVSEVLWRVRPHRRVEADDEEFVVPGLPGGEVRLTRRRIIPVRSGKEEEEEKSVFARSLKRAFEAAERSVGVIFNSFGDLESKYAKYNEKVVGRRCWSIGPVSLSYRNMEDTTKRGKQIDIDVHDCLSWLDSKPPNSVIYVSFGSMSHISPAQLAEIAMALESSGQHFIWVVRRSNVVDNKDDDEQWLPSGFEERNQGKGLVIRGWAPQLVILDHAATAGFVTQCGWNSCLEGVSAGVPMVTWPLFAEQFITEKLITEVLKIGVSVGADQNYDWMVLEARVRKEAIEAAVRRVMVGAEAEEMRRRAAELKELAWKAVQPGGSSYNDLSELVKELHVVCKIVGKVTCYGPGRATSPNCKTGPRAA